MNDFEQKLKVANDLNSMALQMWHVSGKFDGQVVFHMDLFNDWYGDCSPLEIVKLTASGFNPNHPYLVIGSDNTAYSLTIEQYINNILSIGVEIIEEYEKFIN